MNKVKSIQYFLFICILISFFGSQVFAQGYYFQNRYIKLNERTDGFAIIFNNTTFIKDNAEKEIRNSITDGMSLVGIVNNFAYIKIKTDSKQFYNPNIFENITGKIASVKFITPVYYGESRFVTQIPTDEIFVKLKNQSDLARLDLLNLKEKVFIKGVVDDGRAYVLKSSDGVSKNALELCDIFYSSGLFEYAEPNFVYPAEGFFNWTPNDTYYNLQWPLNNTGQSVQTGGSVTYGDGTSANGFPDADMDVNLAWDYVKGNQNVIVAVFDTGVDSLHPDLKDNLITGYNANSNNNTNTTDPGKHGTATLGIIGARSNNGVGVAGIAGGDNGSNHCKIASYRLVTDAGAFVTSDVIARAFDTARVRGVHVSSNSWGGGTPSTTLMNAIDNLANNSRGGLGCIILFSSGNDGRNPPNYPSYLSNVVSVGASTTIDSKKSPGSGDQYWWGGCYGEDSNGDLDIVAPTINITTDIRGTGGYNTSSDYIETFNGTSCSCPNAAGVAALIFSVNPNFTKNQVLDYLYRGCDKIDNLPYSSNKTYGKWNPYTGYGRVNAYNSVRLAAGVDITPPSINHANVLPSNSTYPLTISAEITDQDGSAVPSDGTNTPKLYFRKNKNSAGWTSFESINASSNSGNTFYFKIPCSGYQTEIEYYISAKDNAGNESLFPKNSPSYPCYTAIGTTTIETGKFTTLSMPSSGASVSGSLNMSNYKILDTEVKLYLRHTWVSDFNLTIWNPNADTKRNRVCLFSKNGGSGTNITGATVSDAGTYFWRESTPPYTNLSAKPEHNFSQFYGLSSGGNWKLVYYDGVSGDGGTFDSARLNIKRLSGTTSSCIRLDNISDSSAIFIAASGSKDTIDFYVRNVGNANLVISSYSFSGTSASQYSLLNNPSLNVAAGDSSLFRIVLNTALLVRPSGDNYSPLNNDAVLNINNNDPSKSTFKISLTNDAPLPVTLSSFSASLIGRNVTLEWKTESEINNAGFDVERKLIGSNEWIKAGFVSGKGNSNSSVSYTFEDKKLNSGKYNYRLKQIDNNGNYEYHNLSAVVDVALPAKFNLSQNYPNPFNPTTKIDFDLPFDSKVNIIFYDMTGREVKTLVNEARTAGYYTVQFNASDLSSGVYLYRIIAKSNGIEYTMTKKMLLVK